MAIEEADLAEAGYMDFFGHGMMACADANASLSQEASGCTSDQDMCSKDMQTCDSCGLIFPCRSMKRMKDPSDEAPIVCRHCGKLLKSKQYCGICKKIWHHSDGGDWVFCDGCNVWVHAECANISSQLFKDLEHSDYYCPDLQGQKPLTKRPNLQKLEPKEKYAQRYITCFELCASVVRGVQRCRHLVNQNGTQVAEPKGGRTVSKLRIRKNHWRNGCQIAVHQDCYGANKVQDFTSWVCRACETPDVRRECCLCLVEGGALKPTDVEPLWVYVICAWFRHEVGFLYHEKMEPATGILRIPPTSFFKSCVICKQTHGSCIQCSKCATYFHVMCAARAGHSMELHCLENSGSQITKKLIYCTDHRVPNVDSVAVAHNPSGVFSARNLVQNQQGNFEGSRLISSRKELPGSLKLSRMTKLNHSRLQDVGSS